MSFRIFVSFLFIFQSFTVAPAHAKTCFSIFSDFKKGSFLKGLEIIDREHPGVDVVFTELLLLRLTVRHFGLGWESFKKALEERKVPVSKWEQLLEGRGIASDELEKSLKERKFITEEGFATPELRKLLTRKEFDYIVKTSKENWANATRSFQAGINNALRRPVGQSVRRVQAERRKNSRQQANLSRKVQATKNKNSRSHAPSDSRQPDKRGPQSKIGKEVAKFLDTFARLHAFPAALTKIEPKGMKDDWENVGGYLRNAIDKYKKEMERDPNSPRLGKKRTQPAKAN